MIMEHNKIVQEKVPGSPVKITKDSDPVQMECDAEGVKSDIKFEPLDTSEATKTQIQSVYQIRPPLNEKFKPLSAKEVIHNVLFDQLATKTFDLKLVQSWARDIADMIRSKLKELQFKRYKYVVNVVMGEQLGAGVKIGTRCIWDAEADSYAYENFSNETIFCSATVYAIYKY